MITTLIVIGLIWIVLKVLTFAVEIPFKVVGYLLSGPVAAVFWIVLVALLIWAIVRR